MRRRTPSRSPGGRCPRRPHHRRTSQTGAAHRGVRRAQRADGQELLLLLLLVTRHAARGTHSFVLVDAPAVQRKVDGKDDDGVKRSGSSLVDLDAVAVAGVSWAAVAARTLSERSLLSSSTPSPSSRPVPSRHQPQIKPTPQKSECENSNSSPAGKKTNPFKQRLHRKTP